MKEIIEKKDKSNADTRRTFSLFARVVGNRNESVKNEAFCWRKNIFFKLKFPRNFYRADSISMKNKVQWNFSMEFSLK
jgi:hypothetical protein